VIETRPSFSLSTLSRSINRPAVTLSAVAVAIALGMTRWPALQYLRPLGDFYIGLLQMCVLPFLLATIPLAVRSAMASGTAVSVVRALLVWLGLTIIVVSAVGVVVPSVIFRVVPPSEHTIATIGALVGSSSDRVDIEFALDPTRAMHVAPVPDSGILSVVPTNIFAALSGNESLRVLVFAVIFGIGMVTSERRSGESIFDALRHVHDVCLLIFDWFNLLMPIGVVALIAPQIALLGSDVYEVLSLFSYAFLATSLFVLAAAIMTVSAVLHLRPATALTSLLRPMMLGAATRNTLVCIPLALETMTDKLGVPREPCELYIPVGFATLRFGTILYFSVATLFMGTLFGRTFGILDVGLVAVLSIAASFATLGVTGLAALAPLATVLRPFGLSYELAVPLMIIVDLLANMIRVMLNVALNCLIPALAARGQLQPIEASILPAE
jgi:proton glutamate symport protein